jgi:hypothetical protein
MVKSYRSFLVRCWDLTSGEQRLEVEQIQTGERAIFTTPAEVTAWIDAHTARGSRPPELLLATGDDTS